MAVNIYRFDGDRKQGYKTNHLIITDSGSVLRDVSLGGTVSLDSAVRDALNARYKLPLSTDPEADSPQADKDLSTLDIFDASSGKIITSLLGRVATVAWDPASVADGAASAVKVVTVVGAAVGDFVRASSDLALPAGSFLIAQVTAADTVGVQLVNVSGAAVDVAAGNVKVLVSKPT